MRTSFASTCMKSVLFSCILFTLHTNTFSQLLSTSAKKTTAKPVSKPAAKTTAKPTSVPSVEKHPSKSEPEEKEKPDSDDQLITFATLDELKVFKENKSIKKWKTEKKILLYNLFKNKQLETIKEMDEFWSKTVSGSESLPASYKNAADQWEKNLFNNASYIQYTNMDAIKQLRSSMDGMKSAYKNLSESVAKNKEIFQQNTAIQDVKTYYQLMFDSPMPAKELTELNAQENLLVKVGNDIQTATSIVESMNKSFTQMNNGLDAMEAKVGSKSNAKSDKDNLISNFGGLFKIKTSKEDVPKAGIISMKDALSKEGDAFRKSDLIRVKTILNGNFNEPQKELGGHTPLVFALASKSDIKVIQYILDGGADLNKSTFQMSSLVSKTNVSPLILFCMTYDDNEYQNITLLQTLLDKGAKPYSVQDAKTVRKEAALFYEILKRKKVFLQALKQKGFDIAGDAR